MDLGKNVYINKLPFTDDQLIIQETEGKLQQVVYQFQLICQEHNIKTSTSKTKVTAFRRTELFRSEIITVYNGMEQFSPFSCLCSEIRFGSYREISIR